ncbi:HAD family hydrolase [Corynebacterium otitidis]|uniref:HAD family hydrolase n=1 Tax=Corynebacterium otitidis TaxID=29321 RepID=UPI00069AF6B3|nr:HAD family hydrolase [Corynebacterium otitidis]
MVHERKRRILVFDFDGTVALGDGPISAYAEAIASEQRQVSVAQLLTVVDGALDGYDTVARNARAAGIPQERLDAAYLRSREELGGTTAPITAPEGLAELLDQAAGYARRVLMTNAPDIHLADALAGLGLANHFDEIVTSARKPAGLRTWLRNQPADAEILAIGDIWENDLAPADELGHATVLVGTCIPHGVHPTLTAARLPDLFPRIAAWTTGGSL